MESIACFRRIIVQILLEFFHDFYINDPNIIINILYLHFTLAIYIPFHQKLSQYFIFSTILQLKELGGLLPTTTIITSEQKERVYKDDDGDLTVLGELVASMPIDVTLGKV